MARTDVLLQMGSGCIEEVRLANDDTRAFDFVPRLLGIASVAKEDGVFFGH